MPITRSARIARTAHDKNHLNRLGVPEFGVVQIQIKGQGGNKSKCYRDGSSTTPTAPATDGADTFHFAPGPQYAAATWTADGTLKDDVQITYNLHNPQFAIAEAKIEIFRRFSKDPVWKRDLKDDELLHGEHTLQFNAQDNWDGKIDAHADFPKQFLTVEFSPYKLKLTISGEGVNTSPTAWTYFHVAIAKLELEYGPKDVLPATVAGTADHRKVYDDLIAQGANPPASGASVKVFLESNVFKKGHSMFDNSLFTEYQTLWTLGPLIPIFAKVWVKDSADHPVVAPAALGKVKFLWDWESKLTAPGVTFVNQAQDYEKSTTKPKGENCHKKRGGKRGDKADPVFPAHAGYAPKASLDSAKCPFLVEACPKPRKWAAYSYAWDDGVAGSKTGVMLQPSRMGGDAYTVTVYVAYDKTRKGDVVLNKADDAPLPAPAALKAASGTFQVWRELHLVQYLKKTAGVADLTVGTVQGLYRPAFVELKDNSGGSTAVASGTWNAEFGTAVGGLSATRQDLVDPAVDQHAAGDHGCDFRDLPGWISAIATRTGSTVPAVTASLSASGISTAADHAALCNTVGSTILEGVFNSHLHANEGANIFHVDGLHNHTAAGTSTLRGYALDLPAGTDRKCGYLQLGKTTDYSGPPNDIREFTGAHEFGHHFFLPHTPDAGEKKNYKAHDKAVTDCLMSYNFGAPRKLCGFCQLRLRGWSKDALSPAGARNKK